MDREKSIETEEELETALSFATQTKNKWSRNKGYPPEVLVFGKLSKMPGSIMSDSSEASHAIAMQDSTEGIQFRERLAFRERARKVFCEVDNQQSLRRALNQRSRPQRTVYRTGDWIMASRKDSQWFGSLKVVLQEDKNVIWAVLGNKLFRLAPERARPLSAVEEIHHKPNFDTPDLKAMVEQIRSGNTRFVDVPTTAIPPAESMRENPERTSEQPDGEPGIFEEQDRSRPGSEGEYTPTIPPEEEVSEARNHEVPTIPD